MTERAVSAGAGRAEGEATVAWSRARAEMVGARGLMGVAGRAWARYQTNTEGRGG